ncbi:MAG: helix-turn-helix transcriptional regulator [Clostridia bacterium]|nr:helix-turn-helix transcriptional regulator [Clostridia bacterium]
MRNYSYVKFKDTIKINQLYTVEYYEATSQFDLELDTHDFWELSYVDEGSAYCTVGEEEITLHQGELLLIEPNIPHEYQNKENTKSTILFICFGAKSQLLKLLIGKHTITPELKEILKKMISEIRTTFTFTFNSAPRFIDRPEIGGQQLTQNYLIELLIKLARKVKGTTDKYYLNYKDESPNELINKILAYLKSNIYGSINLDYLSERLFYTKAYLNRTFKETIGASIKNYYNFLKVEESKKLLRSHEKLTVNDISEKLCFDNPSYFIKVFKKYVHITPYEYKKRIL